ncbi:MAG: hypothetical protein Q9179_005045 [Wetmoreana sp. 5 TL-2023]
MATSRKISDAEWQRHEATIRHLYIVENMTLAMLMHEMSSSHGFSATSLTYSLPWHDFVDFWTKAGNSPTPSQATLPTASPIEIYSPGWTSFLSQPYNIDDFDLEDNKAVNVAPLQNEVTAFFGIKAAQVEIGKALERHLRPFVIERQPGETQRTVQDIMDPSSTGSKQLLLSYLALLFSNNLVMDDAVQSFLARAEELHQLNHLKPLFSQRSPSARAIATRLLHAAIHIKATKFLSQALKSGADLESPSMEEKSLTLLQDALKSGEIEAAHILIDAGANVNTGVSARYTEKACSDSEYHLRSLTCRCDITGLNSPLALAAQSPSCVNLIPKLVGNGATISQLNPVLLYAITNNASLDTVSCLISAGADVNQCVSILWYEVTPLSAAAKKLNLQTVQLLLNAGANPNGPLGPEHSNVFERLWSCTVAGSYLPATPFHSPLLCALVVDYRSIEERFDVVRKLLEFGADPNVSSMDMMRQNSGRDSKMLYDSFYYTSKTENLLLYPLQAAADLDSVELVQLLLQHNASVNSAHGSPALTVAVSQANIEMVRLLLSQNADPNGLGGHSYCRSALEAAVETANLELIDMLLESGADINKCSASCGGRTPLQRAAEIGKEQVIEHLLKHGASVLSQPAPIEGVSVLHGFIANGLHRYVSKALTTGTNPNWVSKHSSSPLAWAVVKNDTISLNLLLAADAKVHEYAKVPYPDEEAPPNEHYNLFGFKRLSPIQWAAALNYVEVARILCRAGANVNQPPCYSHGDMALHLAVHRGYDAMVTFLIIRKADVNAYSVDGTALSYSISHHGNRMLSWLLRIGADPNQPCCNKVLAPDTQSPLEYACFRANDSAVQSLLRAGADVSQGYAVLSVFSGEKHSSDCREKVLEILLKYGADVNRRYYDTDTPLQMAIKEEDLECAYRLIEAGACINDSASKGKGGRTALQAASSVGDVDMVEQLLLRGADVNAPAAVVDGVTALQAAAIRGYLRIAQILLEHGADIDAKAGIENGRTAIEGAAEFGRIDMVKMLLDNYQGPQPISQMCDRAYKAAEKGNQWYVMDLLNTYAH